MYDNTYKNELLGFIGIDNTPSNYTIPSMTYPEIYVSFTKVFDKYHMWGLLPDQIKEAISGIKEEQKQQKYFEKDFKNLETIASYRFNNLNILNEIIHSLNDEASAKDIYFQCPILMFIISENKSNSEWESLHKAMITNPETSELVSFKGNHNFIHIQNKEIIIKKIKEWIK